MKCQNDGKYFPESLQRAVSGKKLQYVILHWCKTSLKGHCHSLNQIFKIIILLTFVSPYTMYTENRNLFVILICHSPITIASEISLRLRKWMPAYPFSFIMQYFVDIIFTKHTELEARFGWVVFAKD